MAYRRDIFQSVGPKSHMLGSVVEYDASRRRDPSGGWKIAVLAVLSVSIVISFVYAHGFGRDRNPIKRTNPEPIPRLAADVQRTVPPSPTGTVAAAERKLEPAPSAEAVQDAATWALNSSSRSARERALLQRLMDAERLGRLEIAVDTIEQLRARPSMADLDDKLARRLGTLNVRRLFSGDATPWVAETTVRLGQTVHRIAREHGTTVAAVRRLNGLEAREEPAIGRKLRVLEFQKATFVVHKQTRHADLSLNGKLFKRYYVSVGKATVAGAYPITSKAEEGPRSRFAALGIRVAATDMNELDMFLAPGSVLTVSEM